MCQALSVPGYNVYPALCALMPRMPRDLCALVPHVALVSHARLVFGISAILVFSSLEYRYYFYMQLALKKIMYTVFLYVI